MDGRHLLIAIALLAIGFVAGAIFGWFLHDDCDAN